MLLTVLIGNTTTRLVRFMGRSAVTGRTIPTASLLREPVRHLPRRMTPDAVALCSVVPAATRPARAAIRRQYGLTPFLLTAGTRTGLHFDYSRRELGPDRVCVAVGAHSRFRGDLIVLDFGTAITVNAVSADGRFLGGSILPGPGLMLDSLHARTGRLPLVRLERTPPALPRATVPALQSGVFAAVLGGIERVTDDLKRKTGRRFSTVATGGGAALFRRHLPRLKALDPLLGAHGLAAIWRLNREER
jgi:type III pantothenate kinase